MRVTRSAVTPGLVAERDQHRVRVAAHLEAAPQRRGHPVTPASVDHDVQARIDGKAGLGADRVARPCRGPPPPRPLTASRCGATRRRRAASRRPTGRSIFGRPIRDEAPAARTMPATRRPRARVTARPRRARTARTRRPRRRTAGAGARPSAAPERDLVVGLVQEHAGAHPGADPRRVARRVDQRRRQQGRPDQHAFRRARRRAHQVQPMHGRGVERPAEDVEGGHHDHQRGRGRDHGLVGAGHLQRTPAGAVGLDQHEVGGRGEGVHALGGEAFELVGTDAAAEDGGASFGRERAREVGLDGGLGLHQHRAGRGFGQRAHVGGGGDQHAQSRGPRLGGQAIHERGLAARSHHRDDIAAADAQGREQPGGRQRRRHSRSRVFDDEEPAVDVADDDEVRPGKMYAPQAPLKPPGRPGYVS